MAGIPPTESLIDPLPITALAPGEAGIHHPQDADVQSPSLPEESRGSAGEQSEPGQHIGNGKAAPNDEGHLIQQANPGMASDGQSHEMAERLQLSENSPQPVIRRSVCPAAQKQLPATDLEHDIPSNNKQLQEPDEVMLDSVDIEHSNRSDEPKAAGSRQISAVDGGGSEQTTEGAPESEAESSDEESYAVRPKLQAPGVFTSQLLAEYAAICTPVRSLPTRQSGQQATVAEHSPAEPSAETSRILQIPSMDELGSSLGQASPVSSRYISLCL